MSVKKIFMTLIIVVACVMIGALLLNVLLPNATRQLVNQVEAQIHRATGLSFDFNGDGVTGTQGAANQNVGNQAVGDDAQYISKNNIKLHGMPGTLKSVSQAFLLHI